jgi:hypothetical protein
MYQMNGRQYLLVPASSSAPRRGGPGAAQAPQAPAAADAPLGWVAYALPGQVN